jgi:hypothetical protein
MISGDYDGSGTGDFGLLAGSQLFVYQNNQVQPDLLTSLSNGLGAVTTINYGTLAQGFTSALPTQQLTHTNAWSNYYGGWNSPVCSSIAMSYPTINVSGAIPVVVSTSSSSGNVPVSGALTASNSYQTNYTYSCDRVDAAGRGTLGFTQQTIADPQTSIVQTSDYFQYFPYIGAVSQQTKQYLGTAAGAQNGVYLNTTTNCYAELNGGVPNSPTATTCGAGTSTASSAPAPLPWAGAQAEIAPQYPYLANTQIVGSDLNGTPLPTAITSYTYNGFGEATLVTATQSTGSGATLQTATQQTSSSYGADNTNAPYWILGRLTQSNVSSSTSP